MDINGFGLENEYFGFGGYKQLPNTNTSFMNFGVEDSPEYQSALRKHNSNLEDLTSEADKDAENKRFKNEVNVLKIKYGGEKITEGLGKVNEILSGLGIKPKNVDSMVDIKNKQTSKESKNLTWLWIVLGVVVVGGVGFAIYKLKK